MSNAIINYLAVGATALAPFRLFLVLTHPRDLFLPLSPRSTSRLFGLSLFLFPYLAALLVVHRKTLALRRCRLFDLG